MVAFRYFFRRTVSGITFHRAYINALELPQTEIKPVADCFWQFCFPYRVKAETAIEIHQFGLGMHVQGFLRPHSSMRSLHDRTGKSPEPELIKDIDTVDFEPVRVAGTAGNTDESWSR